MPNSKADLLFHPIRARIIVEISGGRHTAKKLSEIMPDIPKTTLYRHINALADGGVLKVVEENPVRGTVERVYAIEMDAADLDPGDLDHMSREDYEQMFTLFVTSILGDFKRYLESRSAENIDLVADGLRFGKVQLNLDDEEFNTLHTQVLRTLESALNNELSPARKRRIFSLVTMPTNDAS